MAEVGVCYYRVAMSPRVESAHGEHIYICCRAVSLLLLVLLGVLYKYSTQYGVAVETPVC